MTHHVFTRAALYTMVWKEPMRTVAARLGVSDVGLAKACRRHDVPAPERGHWAKLAAGKTVTTPPLPDRPNEVDRIVIAPAPPRRRPTPTVDKGAEVAVPVVAVPADLKRPHPLITAWMKAAAERRRKYRDSAYVLEQEPDLAEPVQQRRMRLYCALFDGLGAMGFKLELSHQPALASRGDGIAIATKYGEPIEFRIYVRQRQTRRPLTAQEKRCSPNETSKFELASTGDLILKIKTYSRGGLADDYRDQKAPLETQLWQILQEFEAGAVSLKAWHEARALEDERRRQEALSRQAREARRAERKRRADLLVEAAGRWREVEALRAFVAAAQASPAGGEPGFADWRVWALTVADARDPLGAGLDLTLPPAVD